MNAAQRLDAWVSADEGRGVTLDGDAFCAKIYWTVTLRNKDRDLVCEGNRDSGGENPDLESTIHAALDRIGAPK